PLFERGGRARRHLGQDGKGPVLPQHLLRERLRQRRPHRRQRQNHSIESLGGRVMPRQKKKTEIDFGDEESVLEDVCAALKADIDTCEIEEDSGLSGFGEGSVYLVTLGIGVPKSEGRAKEYNVAENYDQAYALAVAVVKQDLEQGPELFDKDFIESHINTDKLRDELMSDVTDHRI